jgi:serine/threonine protein kinase
VVDKPIGAGGTAMVYRVIHSKLNTAFALKVLPISSDSIRKRILLEGQVQASLRHVNIAAVKDVLEVGGSPGLVRG